MTPDEARRLVVDLYRKYEITDATTAHRLVRERFDQADLDAYRDALKTLYDAGELG